MSSDGTSLAAAAPAVKPPGWYRFAWFLGRPPLLTERQWRMLGLVAAVSLLPDVRPVSDVAEPEADSAELGIDEASLGLMLSLIQSGALLALFIVPFADRFGSRRVLLGDDRGYTVMTALTALAPNVETFVALQFLRPRSRSRKRCSRPSSSSKSSRPRIAVGGSVRPPHCRLAVRALQR